MEPKPISQHEHAELASLARVWSCNVSTLTRLVAAGEATLPEGLAGANTAGIVFQGQDMLVRRLEHNGNSYVIKQCSYTPERASQVRLEQQGHTHRQATKKGASQTSISLTQVPVDVFAHHVGGINFRFHVILPVMGLSRVLHDGRACRLAHSL
jgi:hypothetical protein